MTSSSNLGNFVHSVGNKLKSSSLVNLAVYGGRSGTLRNRLKEPRDSKKPWRGGSSVQNAVPQTSIFLSFTDLPFGNVLTAAMKVPSWWKTANSQKKYESATKAAKENGFSTHVKNKGLEWLDLFSGKVARTCTFQ
jgi:hypothetical protein